MKGPAKKYIQQVIQDIMHTSVTKIQSMFRAKVARAVHRKRFSARQVIQTHLLTYMTRRKWEREVESHAGNFLEIVIRI